ncbi:MAG: hypothetical protein M0R66_10080 [Candidatus Omnitrophica bacterium]|nr:hypothetical protein [Candidatus Omnitrophota bacterium]
MPNTILHFAPNATLAFLLVRYVDFPVFILINVVINFEAYVVILLRLNYPQHGYLHTFLIGTLAGVLTAIVLYLWRDKLKKLMGFLRLGYETTFKKMLFTAIIGVWLHIVLDMPVYADMKPFFPSEANPLYGVISPFRMDVFCVVFFIPAFILYLKAAKLKK